MTVGGSGGGGGGGGRRGGEGRNEEVELQQSFTTLSTIAIQAGQSQITVSVLKSGTAVHLQLLQAAPGLCEVGGNQEENQRLILELQQLLDKLQKHQQEVLAIVEQKRRSGDDEEHEDEEEEGVRKAMRWSLSEGWALLLHLLDKRREVLRLAADFHCSLVEFGATISVAEDLQVRPTDVQLNYAPIRRDLLQKSLKVLTCSDVLVRKLTQLQHIEALQRKGAVLQDVEALEECSQCSTGVVFRLEELVEVLQDRRRRADQAAMLLIQQQQESKGAESQNQNLSRGDTLDQTLLSAHGTEPQSEIKVLQSGLRITSKASESRLDQKSDSERRCQQRGVNVQPDEDPKPAVENDPTSCLKPAKTRTLESGLGSDLKLQCGLDPGSTSEEPDLEPDSLSDLRIESPTESDVVAENLQPGSSRTQTTTLWYENGPAGTTVLHPGVRSDVLSGSGSDLASSLHRQETEGAETLSKSHQRPAPFSPPDPGSYQRAKSDIRSNPKALLQSSETLRSGSTLGDKNLKLESNQIKMRNNESEAGNCKTISLQSGFKLNLRSDPSAEDERDPQPATGPGEQPDVQTKLDLKSLESQPESKTTSDLKKCFKSAETKTSKTRSCGAAFQSGSGKTWNVHLGSDSSADPEVGLRIETPNSRSTSTEAQKSPVDTKNLQPDPQFRSKDFRNLLTELRSNQRQRSECQVQPGTDPPPRPGPHQEEEPASRPKEAGSVDTGVFQTEPGSQGEAAASTELNRNQEVSSSPTNQQCGTDTDTDGWRPESGSAHQPPQTNRQQAALLSSCELLMVKLCSWLQQSNSLMASCCSPGDLGHLEGIFNTHLKLQAEAKIVSQDAEILRQILDQIRCADSPSETSRQVRPLRALTQQLKRTSAASPSLRSTDGATKVLEELQTLRLKIDSNLQLLELFITFLRTSRQVEQEMEELCRSLVRSPQETSKQVQASWEETLQKLHTTQELANSLTLQGGFDSEQLSLFSVQPVVLQTLEQLGSRRQEVLQLLSQVHQQLEHCKRFQERLAKSRQDLQSIDQLLSSCTQMDLGSELQTSRLVQRFQQARPHFMQLDSELDLLEKSWEDVKAGGEEQLQQRALKEDDYSEVLCLQRELKSRIRQCESVLDMTSRFHLASRQLEALLLSSEAVSCGSKDKEASQEEPQQVQKLLQTTRTLRRDVCMAVSQMKWTSFRLERLDSRYRSLDSAAILWLKEAEHQQQRAKRELLAHQLNDDVTQLRSSFRELKRRFGNSKFNYSKRNDRSRNPKAVRNQLQQVEMYEEKLQVLQKRLQAVTVRLGSEVWNGDMIREAEDTVNELQRQMEDFAWSISDHRKTLEMSRRLQQAMEEYQFWCDEASATIARVGRFSAECRSTDAISVLYQQFEKFVWPTVPEQEERISQIAELAVRLHGAEEGRRYIERTVSKHSEMVGSIRELSDRLMEMEAQLKMESANKEQSNEVAEEVKKEGGGGETDEFAGKDEEKEKKTKENRMMKNKQQADKHKRFQEASDTEELKETGHTPELTATPDLERRAAGARVRALFQEDCKVEKQEVIQDRSETFTSSFCFTYNISRSRSSAESRRRIHTINSYSQPDAESSEVTSATPGVGPLFADIQREFQRVEPQQMNLTMGDGLSEVELEEQDGIAEDSLSSDEYDCASPDDISLPPLAGTPESMVIQSDVEESHCFSPRGTDSKQQSNSHPQDTGNDSGQRQGTWSQVKCCPAAASGPQTVTRSGLELKVLPGPSSSPSSGPVLLSGTLFTTAQRSETNRADEPGKAEITLTGSDQVNTHRTEQDTSANERPSSLTVCVSEAADLDHLSKFNSDLQPDLDGAKPSLQRSRHPIKSQTSDTSSPDRPAQNPPQMVQPCWAESLTRVVPVAPQTTESVVLKNRTKCTELAFLPQDCSSGGGNPESVSREKPKEPFLETNDETPMVFLYQGSTMTTAVTPSLVSEGLTSSLTAHPDTFIDLHGGQFPITSIGTSGLSATQSRSFNEQIHTSFTEGQEDDGMSPGSQQSPTSLQDPVQLEPNIVSILSNSEIQSRSGQGQKSTFTCNQKSAHDLCMTSSSPTTITPPPVVLAQRSHLHDRHNPSPPPLLTTDVCQPVAVREEIRLTPQIKGPPLLVPSPASQTQTGSQAQGRGPPCWTRPLSRAAVMEGSPVVLEVEVTPHPKPTVTWWVAYNELHSNTQA